MAALERTPRVVVTAEQEASILERYQAGESSRAIGLDLGFGRDVVARVLKRRGIYAGRDHGRLLSSTDVSDVLARYQAGESARSIGQSYGYTNPKAVEQLLKSQGVFRRREFQGFTPEAEADLVSRYQTGESANSLAAEHGCAHHTVVRVLKSHGVYQPRKFGAFSQQDREGMFARYHDGVSPAEIARDLGVSQGTVDRVLQRAGVWVPPASLERIGKQYTMDQKRGMATRYGAGDSIYKIAREFGGAPQSIWKILKAQDVEFRDNAWRGGRVSTTGGKYIAVAIGPDDPMASMANVTGYVLEHRLVMARSLGRPLTRNETVHHINGDTRDNRLENLQLRQGNHGKGARAVCLDCGSHNVGHDPI